MMRLVALITAALWIGTAFAQAYPVKPIKIVVPFAPGGATDLTARGVGQKRTESMGQPVVIENRAGASGMIGADVVAKSAPDGYTLLMASTAEIAINPSLYPHMSYDPAKDFAPVTLAAITPLILVVNAGSDARSVQDVVAQARAKPGAISFASAGNGGGQHPPGRLLKTDPPIQMTPVPQKGAPPPLADGPGGRGPRCFSGMAPPARHE